jgi:hypothetical protein
MYLMLQFNKIKVVNRPFFLNIYHYIFRNYRLRYFSLFSFYLTVNLCNSIMDVFKVNSITHFLDHAIYYVPKMSKKKYMCNMYV